MKLVVDRKRTLLIFLIADLSFALLLFLSGINLFLSKEWGASQIAIIVLYVIISAVMLLLALTRNYYIVENKFLLVVKGHKETYHHYADVVFIDKERSLRKRTLRFYTNKGKVHNLFFDKEGKIYEVFVKRCHNIVDKEQFKKQYPKIKI
ncbi:MAG TPA: hypothetical protein GX010_05250 [Erysipelotrichaceae bacterium]|nr:hypothetical protein [Erysipelotrichaceae bacterium]